MTWNDYYNLADKYYRRHGNLATPATYWCMGENLGAWLSRQRVCHLPDAPHPLTDHQVELLDALDMDWAIKRRDWEICFGCAERYYAEHGNLRVPTGMTADRISGLEGLDAVKGFNLYNWLLKQRQRYSIYNSGAYTDEEIAARRAVGKPLTEEQILRMESIGMVWNPNDNAWEQAFAVAERYYKEHGYLSVPKNYEEDGVNLSHWIWKQRCIMLGTDPNRKQRLTEEQVHRLESIGMVWAPKAKGFGYYYDQAKKFYDAYGHTNFPEGDVYIEGECLPESGERLLEWKHEQEEYLRNPSENAKQQTRRTFAAHRKLLYEIGINPTDWEMPWERNFRRAKAYYQENGNLLVPFYYKTEDGIALGKWISDQRMRKKGTSRGSLSEEQIRRLDAIGMVWDTGGKRIRNSKGVEKSEQQKTDNKSENMSENKFESKLEHKPENKLDSKLENSSDSMSKIKPERKPKITTAWERSFSAAKAYYEEHGNLFVPDGYIQDGVDLNYWLRMQRRIRSGTMKNRKPPLTEEQISRLDSIGMPWQPSDARWERSFAVAERYFKEHGDLKPPKDYEEGGINLSHWIWAQRRNYLRTDEEAENNTETEKNAETEKNDTTGKKDETGQNDTTKNNVTGQNNVREQNRTAVKHNNTGKKLTEEQIKRLESIGMDWAPKTKGFSYYFRMAQQFYDAYGHTDFPAGDVYVNGKMLPESGEELTSWKQKQVSNFAKKKYDMKWEHITSLRRIGILPAGHMSPWEKNYHAAEAYYKENGNLLVPFSYITEEGIRLGRWISTQRMKRNGTAANTLTDEQILRLDAIGMVWSVQKQ